MFNFRPQVPNFRYEFDIFVLTALHFNQLHKLSFSDQTWTLYSFTLFATAKPPGEKPHRCCGFPSHPPSTTAQHLCCGLSGNPCQCNIPVKVSLKNTGRSPHSANTPGPCSLWKGQVPIRCSQQRTDRTHLAHHCAIIKNSSTTHGSAIICLQG